LRGHTGPAGEYHYHEIIATRACHLSSNIIGYAFDGFPIYSNPGNVYKSGYEETGTPTTNSWDAYTHVGGSTDTIDRCNGITVDGQYRYYVTSTFPYILGCYAGTPEAQAGGAGPVARSSESFSGPNALARRVWQSGAVPNPPSVPQRPFTITRHGDTRVDSYYWLMNREDPEVLAHLETENNYLAEQLAYLKPLETKLYEEIKSRIEETDISVPVRRNSWWYFERTREGLDYPISCRVPAQGGELTPPTIDPETTLADEQVILDENLEAAGHDFLSVGILSVSPDDQWVAVGTDFEGDERHHVTIRPLAGQDAVTDALDDVYYGFAWASDSRHFFYTRVDDAMRPWQLWRHELGTPSSSDVLVFQENDAQYTVSVGRSRDDAVIVILVGSSTTTEVHFLAADDPTAEFTLLEPRRQGIEYGVEHFIDSQERDWWLKVTNDGATDFRLLARHQSGGEWTELIGERTGSRLDGVDAFKGFLAVSERHDGCSAVRIVEVNQGDDPFGTDLIGRSRLVQGDATPSTVSLSANVTYDTPQLRVGITSLVTPRLVADIVVGTGETIVRKQQQVLGGYDRTNYVTGRLWVSASDGARIPVSVVAHKDVLAIDANGDLAPMRPSPLLLYGYGSYEISIDPAFSSLRLSLLDRGVIFAIAHIRGGGEMGRSWYEMGKLAQKPTTFSDFVTVARYLVDSSWTTPAQLAARGGSAGGLLMGAVMNLAPELFRCVVAEVPFVDALTTMLDSSLPLTVGEWEEWGNPDASASAYRTMKSYAPYDNVRDANDDGSARVYPHLFAAGGLNDSRVGFWEPAKWVLKLRDTSAANVAYLKTEMGAGHGGPSGRYDAWRDEAQVLAFVLSEIGAATP
jgi:oligopeptidase B